MSSYTQTNWPVVLGVRGEWAALGCQCCLKENEVRCSELGLYIVVVKVSNS